MSSQKYTFSKFYTLFRRALRGGIDDFTRGPLDRAIFLLAIPMILEMVMESLFAVVDIFFVGKISVNAIATVALTETVLMIIYAVAVGLSMAATALVSRRIGEKNPSAAGYVGSQAIVVTLVISLVFTAIGLLFPKEILFYMGGEASLIEEGHGYTRIMFAGNASIMFLFLINAIFRGAGDASIAMKVLWISNGINMILDPVLIFGIGPFPELGIEGAAIATTIGRGTAVIIQLIVLTGNRSRLIFHLAHLLPDAGQIRKLIKIALGGIGQNLIGTLSWLGMVRISAEFGNDVLAGYAIAFRIIVFTILPSWGLCNAAATLVGQNLGAGKPERAERSVWRCAYFNMLFLTAVSIVFFLLAEPVVKLFSPNQAVVEYGSMALRIICTGYIFHAYGMVIGQSFNGAGDTKTPTIINLFCFWGFQLPLAYLLGITFEIGPKGIFLAIACSVVVYALVCVVIFRRGKWKTVRV